MKILTLMTLDMLRCYWRIAVKFRTPGFSSQNFYTHQLEQTIQQIEPDIYLTLGYLALARICAWWF